MGVNVLTPVDQGGEVEDGVDEEDVIPATTHMAQGPTGSEPARYTTGRPEHGIVPCRPHQLTSGSPVAWGHVTYHEAWICAGGRSGRRALALSRSLANPLSGRLMNMLKRFSCTPVALSAT